jgi:hypothetical protein
VPLITTARKYLKENLSEHQRLALTKFQALRFRRLQHLLWRTFFGTNLNMLATVNYSDKWNGHWYTQHYQRHFAPLRHKRLNLLEIGVGGYEDPELGGGSLRMWRTYFPRSMIYAIDIYDKTPHNERRIKIFKGSQVDEQFLSRVVDEIGSIDIIIDDGSHLNDHVLKTFHYLFPRLSDNGIYVVEDTQTSYWPSWGGSSEDLNLRSTSMGFLKTLIDAVNYEEFERQNYQPTFFDRNIVGLHFYHNLVFVQKGRNGEGSNVRGK